MKELLEYILNSILGKEYVIEEREDNGKIIFDIKIPKEFIGMVIGKKGRVIKAIQDIIHIKAKLENKNAFINLVEGK